jgi:hypothetical protein
VAEALKETKAARTSKQIIKFLGTGRGENVIRSQEESLKISEESNRIDDIISEIEPLISSNINLGISDFSSAFDAAEENKQISTKEQSVQLEESKGIDAKKININTQAKLLPPITEKTATRKSRSKTKLDNKKVLDNADQEPEIVSEQQVPDLAADSISSKNSSSGVEKSAPEVEQQESKSQASVGLPQWKPRQR